MKVDTMNELIAENQTIPPRYPQYVNSDDPKQMKLLKKIQSYMAERKSTHSVFTSLQLIHEHRRLVRLHEEAQHEVDVLRTAIRMIEGSKTYRRVAKRGTSK